MKKNDWKIPGALLLTLWLAIAPAIAAKVETKKEIKFTFSTDSRTSLTVNSRFSDIDIRHWDQNKTEITAVVTVKAKNEKNAREYLDDTKVEAKKRGNTIAIEDQVAEKQLKNNEEIRITYTILMPRHLPLDINQQFGSLQLPDTNEAVCNLRIRFGNLTGGDFDSRLTLKADFSKIKLNRIQEGRFDLNHSDRVQIGNGQNIRAALTFTGLEAGNIDTLDLNLQHGSFTAGICRQVTLDCNFSQIRFASVTDKLDATTVSHSTVNAGMLSPDFSSVNLDASFSEIRMKLASETAFALDATAHFGDIKLNRTFSLLTDPRDNPSDYHTKKLIGPVNGGSRKTLTYEGHHSTLTIDPTR